MTLVSSLRTGMLTVAALTLVPAAAFAITVNDPVERARIDAEYRACERAVADREISARIDMEEEYADDVERALKRYRDDVRSAWDLTDERTRRTVLRDAKSAYADDEREAKRELSERKRDASKAATTDRRTCKKQKTDAEKAAKEREKSGGNVCFSDSNCTGGFECSVSRGVCNPACQTPGASCIQVCAGTCVPKTTSSSRSSSSSSPSSSSRSSSSQGNHCRPYRCNDGVQFPACTDDGYPISYLIAPCHNHGGEQMHY